MPAAASGSLSAAVADLDAAVAATSAEFDGISEVADSVRFTTTRDPDGNAVTLVEPKR